MSTAHALAEPVQVGLLGIPEAPIVPAPRYSITGQLQRMAEVRLSPDGKHGHLVVQILQPPMRDGKPRPPFVAVYRSDDIALIQQIAARLQAGTFALAICRGIEYDFDRHELRAWRCDNLTSLDADRVATFLPDQELDALRRAGASS